MKSKDLTLGGALTALTILLLYFSALIKTNTLTFLTLAAFMVPVGLIRGNLKTAIIIYISSSLSAFFLVPLNIALLYSLLFGLYGIVKYYVERLRHVPREIFLKLIFFNSMFFLLMTVMQKIIHINLLEKVQYFITRYLEFPGRFVFIGAWLILQAGFLILDYALTLLIDYYYRYASKI